MVRCFEDENVHHVNGKIDSLNDIDTINFELALADIAQIEKRLERLAKSKIKSKEEAADAEVLTAHDIPFHIMPSVSISIVKKMALRGQSSQQPPVKSSVG